MDFSIYDSASGAVLRSGFCSEADINRQAGPGESIWPGERLDDTKWAIIDGAKVPRIAERSQSELVALIVKERARRLAMGFDYDFGDGRGIHRIGTTEADMSGWDEVGKYAAALISAGSPNTEIAVVSDTGPTIVTAIEWQSILIAAGAFRQPIWAASFGLQSMDPIPQDVAADSYWPT